MGFGLIEVTSKKMNFIQFNELVLKKYRDHYLKLKLIFERTVELIDTYHPDEIAIEAPFYGKNVQSMLKLGRAQGVAMAAGLSREIPITEYSPRKIKMAITGNGAASKEQVAGMLQNLLQLPQLPKNLDATDGLAAAVCHYYNRGNQKKDKNYTGWAAFVKQNPNKVDWKALIFFPKNSNFKKMKWRRSATNRILFPDSLQKEYLVRLFEGWTAQIAGILKIRFDSLQNRIISTNFLYLCGS